MVTIKSIFVSTGYVEMARVGQVIFRRSRSKKFASKTKAVESLASALFEKWKEDICTYGKYWCCDKFRNNCKEKFCSNCGTFSEKCPTQPKVFSEDLMNEFVEWINGMPGETADSFGEEVEGWWPWNSIFDILPIKKDEIIHIEHAGPLFAAIVNVETQERFVKRTNEMEMWFYNRERTFEEILEKEIEQRTI